MTSKAAERMPGSGLRVLQAEHCFFEPQDLGRRDRVPMSKLALPASLQLLWLSNLGRGVPTMVRPSLLLWFCAGLLKLYIVRSVCKPEHVDLPTITKTCPALRVLVLHVTPKDVQGMEVSPFLHTAGCTDTKHW